MLLDLAWNASATVDLRAIVDYIAAQNYDAAERLDELIHERVETLRHFPASGRPGRIAGTRELVPHPNYVVIYRADTQTVRVLSVVHARRRYP